MPEVLQEINWIDIVFGVLLLGIGFRGTKVGVGGQLCSLVGLFVLIFAAIAFYGVLSDAVFGFLLHKWAKPISFMSIALVVFIAIILLERLFKITASEEIASIERISGFLVAVFRTFLIYGVLGIFLLLLPVESVHRAATDESKTCMTFVNMDVSIYNWLAERINPSGKDGIKVKKENVMNDLLKV